MSLDEAVRIYRMLDQEGRIMILAAAYAERRRYATHGSNADGESGAV